MGLDLNIKMAKNLLKIMSVNVAISVMIKSTKDLMELGQFLRVELSTRIERVGNICSRCRLAAHTAPEARLLNLLNLTNGVSDNSLGHISRVGNWADGQSHGGQECLGILSLL